MDARVEAGKITISSFMAYLTNSLEGNMVTRLLMLLLVLMVFDTILGWAKAFKAGNWKSSKAKWGLLGKMFQVGFITLAYIFSWALGTYSIEYWFIVYFCLVEVGSILENAYALGLAIPKGIVDIATKSKFFIGYVFVERAKDVIQAVTKMDYDEIDKIAQDERKKEMEQVEAKSATEKGGEGE